MYNETQYLNYGDLNTIEDRIVALYQRKSDENYTRTTWELNGFPYIEDIENIEKGIAYLIETYSSYEEYDFVPEKSWKDEENNYLTTTFKAEDINRWITNLNILEEVL